MKKKKKKEGKGIISIRTGLIHNTFYKQNLIRYILRGKKKTFTSAACPVPKSNKTFFWNEFPWICIQIVNRITYEMGRIPFSSNRMQIMSKEGNKLIFISSTKSREKVERRKRKIKDYKLQEMKIQKHFNKVKISHFLIDKRGFFNDFDG